MSYDFQNQLRDLGLNNGDVVFMHSSMKSLKTDKTPEEFITDVISVIGTEGTLLIPAFTWENVNAEQPYFNVKETEPCDGLIPRRFLRMPGVVRSLHPTHSVSALGKYANELTSTHHLDEVGVGKNSPIMKLLNYDGKILFIGDVLNACTFMHGVEEIVQPPYCLKKTYTRYTIDDGNGHIVEKDMVGSDTYGWGSEFQYIKNILEYPTIKTGKVGGADCFLVEAIALLEKATEKMKQDPYYFVTDITPYL